MRKPERASTPIWASAVEIDSSDSVRSPVRSTLALVAGVLALCGCGGSSTTSSTASPQQADNAQRDVGYLKAMNQIMLPFTKPPASLTDYAGAARRLNKAVTQLKSLRPPAPFAPSQARLVAALREQAALSPRMARAHAAHDSLTLNKLETQLLDAEQVIRAAAQEEAAVYNRCRAGSFRTC